MKKTFVILLGLSLLLIACGTFPGGSFRTPMGRMMGGPFSSIPSEYSALRKPISASSESIARGEQTYLVLCAGCHGETGRGDGIAAAALDPPPAALSFTLHMRPDTYLFYRISEGGNFEPFNSAMPAFKDVLEEDQRWDLVNFVRTLSRGMMP